MHQGVQHVRVLQETVVNVNQGTIWKEINVSLKWWLDQDHVEQDHITMGLHVNLVQADVMIAQVETPMQGDLV